MPILGLIYIRIAKNVYINNAFGFSFDFFPEDIQTPGNYYFYSRVQRQNWVLPALMENVGVEYRTSDHGYFYIGATYHRMFDPLGLIGFFSADNSYPGAAVTTLQGHYFALDFKYFFPTKRTPVLDNGY
jgi:hypothetical protein